MAGAAGAASGSAKGFAAACPAGAGATSASPNGFPASRRRRAAAPPARRLLLLLRRHGKRRPVLPRLLRAHVVPSNEEGDGVRIVNRLNGDARRGRMERASGLHDLPDDRKAGHGSGGEARGPLGQIDRILDVLGDDEVGIARPVAPRERDDEVRDRPSLLGREGVDERRHGRAVEPRAHRPEDILAGRALPGRSSSARGPPGVSDVPSRPSGLEPKVRRRDRACRGTLRSRSPRRASSRARSTPSSLSARSGAERAWGHFRRSRSRGRRS